MSSDFRDYVFAARTIQRANAFLGNGDKCSWTADDFLDLASSVAAENGAPGECPMCNKEVHANSSARVQKHMDGAGKLCVASGQWFHIAVSAS